MNVTVEIKTHLCEIFINKFLKIHDKDFKGWFFEQLVDEGQNYIKILSKKIKFLSL